MPAKPAARYAAALFGYVCVALAFAWPLPVQLGSALLGHPAGDTGVYIWNLWVFRHEIVEHHRLPFLTLEILALGPPVPLVLHNYTTFANVIALPLQPILGIVATFNVLTVGSGVLTSFATFVFARKRIGDDAAAWIAGLLFGFSPFMSARAAGHFSLILTAPLPVFALLLYRLGDYPSARYAVAAGVVVAWAFLCDPYFAVYCLMMAAFWAVHSVVTFERKPEQVRRVWWTSLLNVLILCVGGLIVGIILRGGGRVEFFGLRVSMTQLYTPVLLFTVLVLVRLLAAIRPRLAWVAPPLAPHVRMMVLAGVVCAALLVPLLATVGSFEERIWQGPPVFWRSSAPGVDLLSYFLPNPMNPLLGDASAAWLRQQPNGLVENVASIPWTAMLVVLGAYIWLRFRPPTAWVAFTALFALLALGPFVRIAGQSTYVPTPWALLRFVPVLGAARVPTRMSVLVVFGMAMIAAMAIRHIRLNTGRPRLATAVVTAALLFELTPAPRTVYSADVPSLYRTIAADPRSVRVMNLPFGLRDGLMSRGSGTALAQFYQTFHEKPIVGGYVSRLPRAGVLRYGQNWVMRVLLRLSERAGVTPFEVEQALQEAPDTMERLKLGYVVVNNTTASSELVDFATQAFGLTLIETNGSLHLYRTAFYGD